MKSGHQKCDLDRQAAEKYDQPPGVKKNMI
jgi:hypothetical protein